MNTWYPGIYMGIYMGIYAREAPTINTGEICGIIKAWRMIRWTVFDMEDDKVDGITLYDTMYAADVT